MIMIFFVCLLMILMKKNYRNDISFRSNFLLMFVPIGSTFVL